MLYQLFTGKAAYRAESVAELSRLQESAPTSPSSLIDSLDPAAERVILRCLEKEPAAWTGEIAELPGVELRVEAAAFQGQPVFFRWIGPWSRAERQVDFQPSASARLSQILGMSLFLLVLLTSVWSARRNLLAGRGDRRGAFRVAVFILTLHVLVWLLLGSHVRNFGRELGLLLERSSAAC